MKRQIEELIAVSDKGRAEKDRNLEKYRGKATQYKQKLRLAL